MIYYRDKLSFVTLVLLFFTISSFAQIKKYSVAYTISEKDMIPEGITFSNYTNCFYISSILNKKIVCVNAITGEIRDLASSKILNMSFLGMIIDEKEKTLWACGNREKEGKSASCIAKFSLLTGDLLRIYSNNSSSRSTYNDLVQDNNCNVYFTDSRNHSVYIIEAKSDSISLFYSGEEITHPNGITISPDGKYLYIASTDKGIRTLDIQSRKIISSIDTCLSSTGIDGMKFYNKSLIGIQNGVDNNEFINISKYVLDVSGIRIVNKQTIDFNNPFFDIPTTFVIVGKHLYCLANSQLKNFNSKGHKIINQDLLKDITILKYEL